MPYYLAIDIGASSGRHIVGWREDGLIRTEEVYRFENQILEKDGHLIWDTTPYLKEHLEHCPYTQDQLLYEPLYPDQMVFLVNTYFQDVEKIDEGQAVSSTKTGELLMRMSRQKAQTLAETLTAVFFIVEHIERAGYHVSTMSDAARNFISNWESEKYRSTINEKKQ